MKVFIWSFVSPLTGSYHNGGGLTVIAKDLEDARALILASVRDEHVDEAETCSALTKAPDAEHELARADVDPVVFVFPDAGCC